MLGNYLLIAFRNFRRNKIFSTIHALGLSVGISASLVIFLIVHYEYGFDKFEQDRDRIYRVVMDYQFPAMSFSAHSAAVPAALGSAIDREVTGVEMNIPVFTFQGDGKAKVSVHRDGSAAATVFKRQEGVIFANPSYIRLLSYQWLSGDAGTALQQPFTVVLTESKAKQYFPGIPLQDVVGKQINYNEDITVTVSGIVKDLAQRSDLKAAEFISFSTIEKTHLKDNFMMNSWNDWMAYSMLYVKLAKNIDPARVEAQFAGLLKKYYRAPSGERHEIAFRLLPLNQLHFSTSYQAFNQRIASKASLYGLTALALFLLLLGCINFINLTTAQGARRAREIGIRKTIGSSRRQLAEQFLCEAFFITFIATIVSVGITPLLLKMFADFMPPGLRLDLLHQPYVLVFLVLLMVGVSFLSGLYPAVVLSAHNPSLALKNQVFVHSGQTRNAWIRKTLTVSQFVIAQFFIIATLLVSKQIHYSLNKDLGFRKDAIVNFDMPRDTVPGHARQLLNEIQRIPGVEIASTGFLTPADEGVAYANISYNNGGQELKPNVQIRWGDTNYFKVYDIRILAGRNVRQHDSLREFVVNETYTRELGFKRPEDAIGKRLNAFGGQQIPIVGIMRDFHDQSLHSSIGSVAFEGQEGTIFHIRLRSTTGAAQWQRTIAGIEKAFHRIYPAEDFNYSFFDARIAGFYAADRNISRLLKWATGLTIFISCLGLLGLVIFTTNMRVKEVGIRKVLGASVMQIISILSGEFVRLVLVAFLIAAPVAWWAGHKWLQDFVYRTSMSWWVFVLGGAGMLLVALITLSVQTIKTATANPVTSLRTE